jgi:Flp pilus assembly protein TadB
MIADLLFVTGLTAVAIVLGIMIHTAVWFVVILAVGCLIARLRFRNRQRTKRS